MSKQNKIKPDKLQELLQAMISDLYKFSPDIRRIMTNQLKGVFEDEGKL